MQQDLFKKLFIFLFLCSLFVQLYGQNGALVTVQTPRGSVVGFYVDQGNDTSQLWYGQADVFLGIPFALSPVGELRYKRPRPLIQYPGSLPYNATFFRKQCIQPNVDENSTSEDCLHLNIWTPNASSTKKYPVMVWIHGGSLINGNSQLGTGGVVRNLVSKEIVVVSIEYRMSWLGFFTTSTEDFPSNLGMLDMILALKFIKEEIPYFGGDPNRVTIFGESAGGHSVSALTYSPITKGIKKDGLFQQAIAESGSVLTCYEDSLGFTRPSYLMAKYACNYTDEMWNSGNFGPLKDCLMKIDVHDGMYYGNRAMNDGKGLCWNMVQDNYFFPGDPQDLAKLRPNIPYIIGTCKDEWAMWEMGQVQNDHNLTGYTKNQIESRIENRFSDWLNSNGNQTSAIFQIFEDNYLPKNASDEDHMTWLQYEVDVMTSAYFTWSSHRDVQAYIANNNPNVYTYEFIWSSTINNFGNPLANWNPAPHGCEVNYLLNYGDWSKTDQDLANLIQTVWANFAKYGQPTTDGSWKPTTSKIPTKLEYFEFSNVSTMKIGYRTTDQIVWNEKILGVMGDRPPNLPVTFSLCSSGYQSKVKNTTCYQAFNSSLTWSDAQKNCGTNSYGTLVTIGNAFENSDLLTYAKNAYPSCSGFYVGLFKSKLLVNNENWNWANYDTSIYRNWKTGYPNPDSNAYCTVINSNDGTWTNQACDIPECYICSY